MRVGSVEEHDGQLSLLVSSIVFDREGNRHWIRPMLDTGFNGALTLSGETIDALDLEFLIDTRARLADGSEVVVPTYRIQMVWRDEIVEADVYRMESDPLLGMDLIRGVRIEFDAVHLGEILAKPIDFDVNSV